MRRSKQIKILAFSILILFSFSSCSSQSAVIKDLSKNLELNYILSNIWKDKIAEKSLWNGSQFLRIFEISDSKATPDGYFEGSDEILSSLIISSAPDGDYYTNSKLYKIEGLLNPKIIEIKEEEPLKFSVKVEYGYYEKRQTKVFAFEGVE